MVASITWNPTVSYNRQLRVFKNGSQIFEDRQTTAHGASGTLTVSAQRNGDVSGSYDGKSHSGNIGEEFYGNWLAVVLIRSGYNSGATPTGPFMAGDDFSFDGTYSDDFNRASGTLYSDPSTFWEEFDGVGESCDIVSNQVEGLDGGSNQGVIYWDKKSKTVDTSAQINAINLVPLTQDGDSFLIGVDLINYRP
jgi:hypothetical protein